jgi:hypothetical protein
MGICRTTIHIGILRLHAANDRPEVDECPVSHAKIMWLAFAECLSILILPRQHCFMKHEAPVPRAGLLRVCWRLTVTAQCGGPLRAERRAGGTRLL